MAHDNANPPDISNLSRSTDGVNLQPDCQELLAEAHILPYAEKYMIDEERDQERKLFEKERLRVPDLFIRNPLIDNSDFLKWIGIDLDEGEKPIAYLRLMPQDFIVEEIRSDGTIETVDFEPPAPALSGEGSTLYATLVKIGISTLDAKTELAKILGIEEKHIGFAGIKDRVALTAQRISIRGNADPRTLDAIAAENFFLKHIERGKGAIANGNLQGNRFIITLRLQSGITQNHQRELEEKLADIRESGFWNFFSFQRFGTPRLLSYTLGRLLVQGRYEETIKTFVTVVAPRELPYFKKIREELAGLWGNWETIEEKLKAFPYHFHLERSFIRHLQENPKDFLGALHTLPDQIRLWIYAYDCYLFNRKLSELIKRGEVPLQLPLITSFNPRDWELYSDMLEADGVNLPSRSYQDFPFVRVESRTCPTLQNIELHGAGFRDNLAFFAFSLPKGAYATTFLMNFFTLTSGLPVVPGISTEKVDAKDLLTLGTLHPTLDRFKAVLDRRDADIANASGE